MKHKHICLISYILSDLQLTVISSIEFSVTNIHQSLFSPKAHAPSLYQVILLFSNNSFCNQQGGSMLIKKQAKL